MRASRRRGHGFTLIEVILVIAIIGVLAGVLIFAIGGQKDKADRDATAILIKQVSGALDRYKLHVGRYPTEEDGGLEALRKKPQFEDEKMGENWAGPYLESEPKDPWGTVLTLQVTEAGTEEAQTVPYKLWSNGPNKQDDNGSDDDIRNKAWEESEQTR
jgi:general secretion pathway protein G